VEKDILNEEKYQYENLVNSVRMISAYQNQKEKIERILGVIKKIERILGVINNLFHSNKRLKYPMIVYIFL
jgi:hypothetical protein